MRTQFEDIIISQKINPGLVSVIGSILSGVAQLSNLIYTADVTPSGTTNVYGEKQLSLDILAHNLFENVFQDSNQIGLFASEELPEERLVGEGTYAVAIDPLDGSSLVDVNFAVGSIFGIYNANTFIGRRGREQVAALFAVYGPRTTVMISVGHGVIECTLGDDGKFFVSQETILISEEGNYFAPGNLRACAYHEGYAALVNYWMKQQYTLRYSGGMVPDINHILRKGKGIFTYPGYSEQPDGKLRLLFECAPMAFLVEQAGGAATDGSMNILDKQITVLTQRTPILIGSKKEVERAQEYLKKEFSL